MAEDTTALQHHDAEAGVLIPISKRKEKATALRKKWAPSKEFVFASVVMSGLCWTTDRMPRRGLEAS
jgi:hypothetical protein